ncbi:MAG: DUF2478 domain-containing protein [Hyphomicrobiaceae bacterium]|nr:MAG: DUF2478 domain-containing protein [Hyphomicrobiaceae bacterium]
MKNLGMSALGAIHYQRGYDIDRLLVDVCEMLVRDGLRLGGLLQVSTGERGGSCAATVHVVDLRTGRAFDIWQDRGPCAQGCRLDEAGLATAEPVLLAAIEARVELLVVNRFGRAEGSGRGLRACFEAALAAEVPVLTAVRAPYDESWAEFHGGLAKELPASLPHVVEWVMATCAVNRRAHSLVVCPITARPLLARSAP